MVDCASAGYSELERIQARHAVDDHQMPAQRFDRQWCSIDLGGAQGHVHIHCAQLVELVLPLREDALALLQLR